MKNNKGFTLVELLAVIVILGLLSIIIVPKIFDSINESKKKGYNVSINNLVKMLNSLAIDKKQTLTPFDGCSYNFDNGINDCDGLEFSGDMPEGGSISVDRDGNVNGDVWYNENRFLIANNDVQIDLLPLEYMHVEYIESTGTQYIDTGIYADNNSGVYLKYRYHNLNDVSARIFGNRDDNNVNAFAYIAAFTGTTTKYNNHFYISSNGLIGANGGSIDSDVHEVKINVDGEGDVYFDNIFLGNSSGGSFTRSETTRLFSVYNGSNGYQYGVAQLYGCKMYENGDLIRDFIPCYRKSDGVVGLYDNVNNVFYTNSGTGEFIKSID